MKDTARVKNAEKRRADYAAKQAAEESKRQRGGEGVSTMGGQSAPSQQSTGNDRDSPMGGVEHPAADGSAADGSGGEATTTQTSSSSTKPTPSRTSQQDQAQQEQGNGRAVGSAVGTGDDAAMRDTTFNSATASAAAPSTASASASTSGPLNAQEKDFLKELRRSKRMGTPIGELESKERKIDLVDDFDKEIILGMGPSKVKS
jgi:hypothetical protein